MSRAQGFAALQRLSGGLGNEVMAGDLIRPPEPDSPAVVDPAVPAWSTFRDPVRRG
jgi:hypothetical protein